MRRSREFVRQTAEHIRSLPMPFGDRRDQTLPITENQKVKEDKDLDEAFQVVQDNFSIAPGQYVPGLSLKSTTAAAPPEAAAEAAKIDVSDFEQFKDFDKSTGATRRRRSLSARSHSKSSNEIKVKSESGDEEPPPCTDGWLPVIVNSPTSPAEEENEKTVRSPSFEQISREKKHRK